MALLWMDGFDAGDTTIKYTSYNAGSSSASTRFSSGRCWTTFYALYKLIPPTTDIFVGTAMTVGSFTYPPYLTILADSASIPHISLTFTATLAVIRRGDYNGTIIASQTYALTAGWHYIELYVNIHDTTGSVTAKVDGVTVATFSGDTKNGGTSTNADCILIGHPAASIAIDDLYIANSSGAAPYNTFLGDVRVHTMSPNGAGASTQLTPSSGANYTTVDELPYSSTDYVAGNSPTLKDTYAMSDLPAGTATIYGLQTNVIAKKTDAGTIAVKPVIRSGGTDYAGTSTVLTAGDAIISDLRNQDPATSAAWTAAGLNGIEAGVEIA